MKYYTIVVVNTENESESYVRSMYKCESKLEYLDLLLKDMEYQERFIVEDILRNEEAILLSYKDREALIDLSEIYDDLSEYDKYLVDEKIIKLKLEDLLNIYEKNMIDNNMEDSGYKEQFIEIDESLIKN